MAHAEVEDHQFCNLNSPLEEANPLEMRVSSVNRAQKEVVYNHQVLPQESESEADKGIKDDSQVANAVYVPVLLRVVRQFSS